MVGYVILTNPKRAVVALAHSVAFLALATYGLRGSVRPLQWTSPHSLWVLPAIYLVVSSVLIVLTAVSGTVSERLYFGFCATSASFGLARQIAGDPRLHVAVYVRVTMLGCAVLTGLWILRGYRTVLAQST
jgi:hypothetical protein